MEAKPPFQPLLYLALPDAFLASLIAAHPPARWRLLGFCLYVYIYVHALSFTSGDPWQDFGLGGFFAVNICTAIHFLWLSNPVRDFRHERDSVLPTDLPFLSRVYWAFCLKNNFRGIGWNCQNPHIVSITQSRWQFFRSNLFQIIKLFFMVDLAQSYIHSKPLFSLRGNDALSITDEGYFLGCLNLVAFWLSTYAMMSMEYLLLGTAIVSLGISEPEFWPPLFGPFQDTYTVRRFWGRAWHQILRRFLTSMGKFCSHTLRLTPGSTVSSYTELYTAFIISGMIHTYGDFMVDPKYVGISFPFFLAQAMAITFEDSVIYLARRAGLVNSNAFTRIIGYFWVSWWFYISAPRLTWIVEAGLGIPEALPLSPIRIAWKLFSTSFGPNFFEYFPS